MVKVSATSEPFTGPALCQRQCALILEQDFSRHMSLLSPGHVIALNFGIVLVLLINVAAIS